jgi:AcrR family transcriptional regulator
MARRYNSQRRAATKAQTIENILAAAIRLHGQGVTEMSAVARAAGVSLATVHKYFPTREDLFQGCTALFLQHLPLPSLDELARIQDPVQRLSRVVQSVYAVHEAAFSHAWLAHRLERESPTMAQTVAAMQQFVESAVTVALGPDSSVSDAARRFALGLLSPLTYRALRLSGGLDHAAAVVQTTAALAQRFGLPGDLA